MTRQSPWVLGRYMTIDQVVRPRRHEAGCPGNCPPENRANGSIPGRSGEGQTRKRVCHGCASLIQGYDLSHLAAPRRSSDL